VGPVLIHVITEKGRGYLPAETAADKMHGVVKFDPRTGKQFKSSPAKAGSYTNYFADSLVAEAQRDSRVLAVHAAMAGGTGGCGAAGLGGAPALRLLSGTPGQQAACCNHHPPHTSPLNTHHPHRPPLPPPPSTPTPHPGLYRFEKHFPERTFDVGIAEQHAVTFAAGLACEGLSPFCTIYSTFLQRGYDQVVHDVSLQKLPGEWCAWGGWGVSEGRGCGLGVSLVVVLVGVDDEQLGLGKQWG